MARVPRGGLALWAPAATLLVASLALPAAPAQAQGATWGFSNPVTPFEQAKDDRIKLFAQLITGLDVAVSRADSEFELNTLATTLGRERARTIAAFQGSMRAALGTFTAHRTAIKKYEERLSGLNAAVEAERARIAAPVVPPEESALEGVIAQARAVIADLEGRQQRVATLEAKLKAMPTLGFMNSAPREAAEAELAEARTNLPAPGAYDQARRELAHYIAELDRLQARRPKPPPSRLPELEQEISAINAAIFVDQKAAAEAKTQFQRLRAQALGFIELFEWLEGIINNRLQALRAPTGTPAAFAQCATTQGPFRCTGAFDGTWSSVCGDARFQGPAKVTIGPDGWTEVTMIDASARSGASPTVVGGKISADGSVIVEHTRPGQKETYRGKFSLVKSTASSGAMRPVGGGTYELVLISDKGAVTSGCSGSMKLN